MTSTAHAQNMLAAEMTGQPLQYMRDGEISGCGLRIIAGRPLGGGRFEISEISVNFYATGATLLKAIAYDTTPINASAGALPATVKVTDAWIKAEGSKAATPIGKSVTGDDKNTLMFATDMDSALAVLAAQNQGKTVQLSVRRTGSSHDSILFGKVTLEPSERQQLAQCLKALGDDAP